MLDLSKRKGKIILAAIIASVVIIVATAVILLRKDTSVFDGSLASYISPGKISLSDTHAYVSDNTKMKIYKVNLEKNKIDKEYSFDDQVNGVVYAEDKVYALTGGLAGNVVVIDANLSKIIKTVPVGHTPVDALVHQDKIYVANRFSNNITVIDKNSLEKINDIDVSREPVSIAQSGNNLFVACHLVSNASTDNLVAADLSVIDLSNNEVSTIKLQNGTSSVKGICASPDGKYLYLSHIAARFTYPTTQVDRGWIVTNAVTIIDAENKTVKNTVLLDAVDNGAANPWGIACNQDGSKLVVSLAGSHDLMIIDTNKMLQRIEDVERGRGIVSKPSDVPNYLPFLDGIRTRISLDGRGPRNLAVKDGKAYVCQYFSGDIAVVDLNSNNFENISLGEQPEANMVRQGESLWHDGRTSHQEWLSCSSCHPDARVDGFSWDEMGDGPSGGYGNPLNTKSLLKSYVTPPILIIGSGNAEAGVRGSFDVLSFKSIPESDAQAIDEYLKSLKPVSSPYLNRDGTLTEQAERGKQIYDDIGCVTCHPAPFYTDTLQHRVVTVDPETEPNNYDILDTPSLLEVWRTGPWLFNGKAATMQDAIILHLGDLRDKVELSDEELNDLTMYVLSIGSEGEFYSVDQIIVETANNNRLINKIEPNSNITEIGIRKHWKTDKAAKVTVELFDKDDKSIAKKTEKVDNLGVDSKVIIPLDIKIPENFEKGGYLKVTIVNNSDSNDNLASDYFIRY